MPEARSFPEGATGPAPAAAPVIDLAALAERVYRLLLEDLRLEQARSGTIGGRREVRR